MKLKASFGFLAIFFFNVQGFAQLEDAIRLTLSSSSFSDETIVRFLDDATDSFDADWDAYKLSNGGNTPNFYTEANQEPYTINALHKPFTDKTVSLNLEVAFSGTYTITSEEIGPFDSLCTITLIDKVLNVSQDLKVNSEYSFDFVVGDSSDRFLIEFRIDSGKVGLGTTVLSAVVPLVDNSIRIYNVREKVVIEFVDVEGMVFIAVYNLSGKEILKSEGVHISASNSSVELFPELSGVGFVKVMAENKLYSERVLIDQ